MEKDHYKSSHLNGIKTSGRFGDSSKEELKNIIEILMQKIAILESRNQCFMNLNVFGYVYSRLSRCGTARGSSSGLSLGDLTKVKAHKSFIFTESWLKFENNEHLIDFVVRL